MSNLLESYVVELILAILLSLEVIYCNIVHFENILGPQQIVSSCSQNFHYLEAKLCITKNSLINILHAWCLVHHVKRI